VTAQFITVSDTVDQNKRWDAKYSTQKIAKKSPSGHNRTTLSSYIGATKAHIDNRKKTC